MSPPPFVRDLYWIALLAMFACLDFLSPGRPHVRYLQCALKCLLECHKPLQEYPDHYEHEEGSPSDPLLSVLVHRLQAVLKQLVVACMKKRY